MGSGAFGFEMEDGKLTWTYPANAPGVTADQARTVAIAMLAGALDRLADSVSSLADRGKAAK
jgi:hypothetical protein